MGAVACCTTRGCGEEEACDKQPVLRVENLSINNALDAVPVEHPNFTQEESLEKEWAIIKESIEPLELERLEAFAMRVKDCGTHAACQRRPLHRQAQTLLRFLRGREGDVQAAEVMFRASLDWRRDFGVEEKVSQWHKEQTEQRTWRARLILAYSTDAEICKDRHGVPVWLMRMSVSDPAGMLRELGQETLLLSSLARMEAMHSHLRHAMFQTGRLVRGCVQVIDVGDYGRHGVPNWFKRMWDGYRVGRGAFKIFDLNYPETTRKVFIIRMGPITSRIYKAILPLVPERTRVKVRMFNSQAASWRQELIDELPPEPQLPEFLVSDGDYAFATARPVGGLVPVGGEIPVRRKAGTASNKVNAEAKSMNNMSSSGYQAQGAWAMRPTLPTAFVALLVLAAALTVTRAFSLLGLSRPTESFAAG